MTERETRCRVCGRPIRFVRTRGGKLMPVETTGAWICVTGRKNDRMLLREDGESVHGYLTERDSPTAEAGFLPHFAVCRAKAKTDEDKQARREEAEQRKNELVARLIRERFGA